MTAYDKYYALYQFRHFIPAFVLGWLIGPGREFVFVPIVSLMFYIYLELWGTWFK